MQEIAKILGQSITRYILPGLIFYVILIWLPFLTYLNDLTDKYKITDTSIIVIIVIVIGYLLDAIGAYRYTWHYKNYAKEKRELANKISALFKENERNDPDRYLSKVWLNNYQAYERIFDERSEWVMILIASFLLTLGALEQLIFAFYMNCWIISLILTPIYFILSFLASQTGIKRMIAHNDKVIEAVNDVMNKLKTKSNNRTLNGA